MKTGTSTRNAVAGGAIVLSVFAGGYLALVEPATRELGEVRGRLAAVTDEAQQAAKASAAAEALGSRHAQLLRTAASIEERNAAARDRNGLFAAVSRLAEKHGVRVEQLDPIDEGRGTPAEGEAPNGDAKLSYDMRIIGSFGDVAEFLGELQHGLGHTRVRSVTVIPTYSPDGLVVQARIRTDHLLFDVSPAVAQLTGVGEGTAP